MKKFVVLLLVTMMLFAVPVLASDTIDLKSMSDKDLLKLQENVQNEIKDRGIDRGSEIPTGRYIAGIDIKTGRYVITGSKGDPCVSIFDENGKLKDAEILSNDESMYAGLSDGYTLEVGLGGGYIKEVNPDWAPTESIEQPAK